VPNRIDLRGGADALLYDAYNYLGQRVTHVGRGDLGVNLYARALAAQERLRGDPPPLSPRMAEWLARHDIDLATARILPWEWTTQIGHLGMLDVLFRMRALGWWSGKAIILAHRDRERIANHAFLGLFRALGGVVIAGPGLDRDIDDELFSLQRYSGLSFNAWKDPSGAVVPWQEAGALVMRRWEGEHRPLPLRDAFDARYQSLGLFAENVAGIRARWGMKPDDWYACLHMRDPGFYGEAAGAGQTHRNASAASYLEAVTHVIDQGGWVVKLGGPHSLRLPAHPRVIDYARGKVKSGLMDLMLIRQARIFIGTTSGLTNVAISFGIPAALVNCITTDAQLWSGNVRFAPKPIVIEDGRILSQRQLTSSPWRWRMFSAELLRREGALQRENSSDEILQTVSEVLQLSASGDAQPDPDPGLLLDRWRAQLALPHFYGAARPSRYFLEKYRSEFLAE
jgi:putative glycosyltransferase (TIGR04372 family)